MGYTTDFSGEFEIFPALEAKHNAYLARFNDVRHMHRDASLTSEFPDPVREAVDLPLGQGGEFYVGDEDRVGQSHTPDILDYNKPAPGVPGLWCGWVPNEEGTSLEWDGGEKFYDYVEWLEYLIDKFFRPWGYRLNGRVRFQGEDWNDRGVIRVVDNEVDSSLDTVTNRLEED